MSMNNLGVVKRNIVRADKAQSKNCRALVQQPFTRPWAVLAS